jgi:ABC-2 type transport system ATP-binding protein
MIMSAAISVNNLTKHYPNQKGARSALDNLSISVEQGTLFGLVGPDGAGKTTLMRILATVLSVTGGDAQVLGADVEKSPETIRKLIGYMPQNFSLYPDLSVMENLRFFADMQGVTRKDQQIRIASLLDFARLQDFQNRRSEHLSGGMRKKLALACALIHSPKLLLLDEPTTGVDPVSRRELWKLLADVIQQGVTVMVSTPYMDEAERCHQVGMLYQGSLLSSGKPQELETAYPYAIVEVKATPRKLMREAASKIPDVVSWRPVGDRLRISTRDAGKCEANLRGELNNAGADIKLLRKARPSMEDVFIHLSEGRGR